MADSKDSIFGEHRRFLFAIAYRMLGSASDAEDIVQDCYVRWREAAADNVESPKSYLAAMVTRLAINHLESARVRREQNVGTWLPEPVLTTSPPDPAEMAESLTMAFLTMLENLSPVERAVFLLAEVFDYRMSEIAGLVGKSEVNCRQILRRARKALAQRKQPSDVKRFAASELLDRFWSALHGADADALLQMMNEDVVVYADGGGKVPSALNPIYGSANVTKWLLGVMKKGAAELVPVAAEVNGQPGAIAFRDGAVQSTITFDIAEGRIRSIYIVSNPDKLAAVAAEVSHDSHNDEQMDRPY